MREEIQMADNGTATQADLNVDRGRMGNGGENENGSYFPASHPPQALREALRATNGGSRSRASSESTSEEDWDEMSQQPVVVVRRQRTASGLKQPSRLRENASAVENSSSSRSSENGSFEDLTPLKTQGLKNAKVYTIAADDKELKEILRRGMQRDDGKKHKGQFRDFVFTRNFSTFDRQNEVAANSPFHGFYTLFWIAVFLFMVKIGAENWKRTGSALGTNEIMKSMFRRDVIVLLASDGVMCGVTGVSWLLQKLIYKGYIDWDRSGWILQNVWQSTFIAAVLYWPFVRDWPWSHTVFFTLHGLIMLMKQHSYAFYNGYLSSAYKKRIHLLSELKKLDGIVPVQSPSTTYPPASALSTSHLLHPPSALELKERRQSIHNAAAVANTDVAKIAVAIKSGEPLDEEQVHVFERIIKWEADALTEELKGKSTDSKNAYPNNLTFTNHYEYIVLPTLVYELEYPRSDTINWLYVAEKAAATFGLIFVMIMVSQAFIYPVVIRTVDMKESGMTLAARFREFPWMLSDLIFPFMMEYLLTWYLIWEAVLNLLAELTYFADRSFYDDWWNSTRWDYFARAWNRPVHNFLLRHVYHSSISALKVNKYQATLITFFLSACVHELVMWCIFRKLRGYLLMLQMFQLPLVSLSRTNWLKNQKTLGNMIFWLGIFTGPSVLCSLYLIL